MITITTQDVRDLKQMSLNAGDTAMVERCDRALAGEQDAWWLCKEAIIAHHRQVDAAQNAR